MKLLSDTIAKQALKLLSDTIAKQALKLLSDIKIDTRQIDKKGTMSHIFFCAVCSKPAISKCGGCMEVHYCGQACQQAVWEEHKAECETKTAERLERELFGCVCARLGRDVNQYPFENFKGFMKHQAHLHEKRTMAEWMEDWLLGDMERKAMLRGIFHTKGLKWSADTYTLYEAWAEGRTGNRFQKMTAFVKATRWLF